jgi:NAD+ synthase
MTETLDRLTLALAQLNPTVGDLTGNAARLRQARAQAAEAGADLLLGTELFLSGYPPEDLVLKPAFIADVRTLLEELAAETADGGPAMIIGAPWEEAGKLYNAAFLLDQGRIQAKRFKHELPNYGVFDEKRVFVPGPLPGPVIFRGIRLGVMICEDMWLPDVTECLAETGAEMLLVPNGSPFEARKVDQRMNPAVARVIESGLPLVYVNQVGGQDELVFDGASFALQSDGALAVQMKSFEEDVSIISLTRTDKGWRINSGPMEVPGSEDEQIYRAMMLGLKDYIGKNGFPGVIFGLSGGIDSAITAAVAVDALGADRVRAVMLPSRYTSQDSLDDAAEVARLLNIRLDQVDVEPAVLAFQSMLAPLYEGRPPGLTEENIQSRVRGLALMALSNKLGPMLMTTGNKSEVSVGYATLYGDMCGGFSVLKDVYKTDVFALSRWRNSHLPHGALGPDGPVMPERVITKPPTAELRDNQKDEDSLPPYDVLDDILDCLVEKDMAVAEIIARGHAPETVRRVQHLLYSAEFKRRQAAPGVKTTRKIFGRERRYPIINRYRDTNGL